MTNAISEDWPSIPEFYDGKSVLITGASGFIGQVLIEKILRSCPKVREIFMLMRPKKNTTIDERLHKLLKQPLYDRLAKENPSFVEKLIPIQGDVSEEGLGLSPLVRQTLIDRVSIIFHAAANVKFDDHLKHAVFVNTRSTRDICILAGSMKNLVALVHVSSTYAQADKQIVDEVAYPPLGDWRKAIQIAENLDEMTLRALTPKYLRNMPNTYTFTKRLAEQVIIDYSKDLPCVIFRPSIVIASMEEPMPGWTSNFNGPNGLMVGGGKGILRVLLANPSVRSDYMPVDIAIKAMIVSSWKRAMRTVTRDPSVDIYNCAASELRLISTREMINLSLRINAQVPIEGVIWTPSVTVTSSPVLFYFLILLFHLLPAFFIDLVLRCNGYNPMVMRLQRKVYVSNSTLSYFLLNEWTFRSAKFRALLEKSHPRHEEEFGFKYESINEYTYIQNSLMGGKLYLLGDNLENRDKAKQHYDRMVWIDKMFKTLLIAATLYVVHCYQIVPWIASIVYSSVASLVP